MASAKDLDRICPEFCLQPKEKITLFRVSLLIVVLLSASLILLAQAQANTGNIEGRVTDPNAASVPNVTVTATNLATGLQKTAQTNDEGVYRIVFLPPGAYKVETSGASGFVPANFTNVIVTVGGARISLFESTANSRYNALAMELKRRFTRGFQFIAADTFSDANDNRPDQTMVVVGADDAKGLQNNLDIRHRFVFSPVYEIGTVQQDNAFARHALSNWTFSGIITLQSGFAYSALIAGDANRDGNPSTDRVPGTERNGFTTPSIYIFDARVTKAFRFTEK